MRGHRIELDEIEHRLADTRKSSRPQSWFTTRTAVAWTWPPSCTTRRWPSNLCGTPREKASGLHDPGALGNCLPASPAQWESESHGLPEPGARPVERAGGSSETNWLPARGGLASRSQTADVGIYDRFFEVGGDSIKAIQIVSRLRRAGLRIEMRDFLQFPTVAGLADARERASGGCADCRRSDAEQPEPCFFDVRRIGGLVLIISRDRTISKKDVRGAFIRCCRGRDAVPRLQDAKTQPYFRQMSFRIEGCFDPALCESAWNELMSRHELLRSVFNYENTSQLLQIVLNKRAAEFAVEDVAPLDEPARSARLDQYRAEDRARGFDLRCDCLMRVKVFRLGPESFEMIWSHPHILLDGWSGSVLLAELRETYLAKLQNRRPALPEVAPYSAYLDWLAARDAEKSRRYWEDLLAGYEAPATVPRNTRGRLPNAYRSEEHSFLLTPEQTSALASLAARNGVTVNTVMLSLWGVLLSRCNDAQGVVFGSVVSGRPPEVPGIERMVGLFINTKPVRIRTPSGQTFASLLVEVQAQSIEAAHDHLALAEIQAMSPLRQRLLDHLVF